jgi:CheY-like chemotaxis protein
MQRGPKEQECVARLWDLESGKLLAGPWTHPKDIWSLFRSPNGDRFASACADGHVRLLSIWIKPNLIILDMLLPHLDGWGFLDALRQTAHRAVPVIITTGANLTRVWAEDHGCAGLLRKPFEMEELLVGIRRVFAGE